MRFQLEYRKSHAVARARFGGWRLVVSALLLAGGGWLGTAEASKAADAAASVVSGPTLQLAGPRGDPVTNAVAAFMYFVPLISPEPVTARSSPGSTQAARILSIRQKQSGRSLLTTCDFDFTGQGAHQSVFDCSREIKRHEAELKAGGKLARQLRSITVTGTGRGQVEVESTLSNAVPTVTRVRLRFNQGQTSPVSIGLSDIRYAQGDFQAVNELVARVNTLTFRRKTAPPKMEVTVASVKNKGAGDNLWQDFKGGLKGATVNLLIEPLAIEAAGQAAMLEFGRALAAGAANYTFPRAEHLK